MRKSLRYVLVTDGSSDACLLSPIEWLLRELGWRNVEGRWADLRDVPGIGSGLAERLRVALAIDAADLVFVHRDAEAEGLVKRTQEIEVAVRAAGCSVPHVCVVPVRMTEAWLLHDEVAIRVASGKPNGRSKLPVPPVRRLEELSDPKSVLLDALLVASESHGGRLKSKRKGLGRMRLRVAELITDYAPLRVLEAFSRFEHDLGQALERL